MMRRIPALVLSVYLMFPQLTFADLEGKENWEKFIRNSTVLGLTPGETKMDKVLKFFGAGEIVRPHKKHEMAKICYKNSDATIYLILWTGSLHDFSTLYVIEILNEVDESKYQSCLITEKLNRVLATKGGLKLGLEKEKVIRLLGSATKVADNELSWKYEYHEIYEKPIISYGEAGPSNDKYTQKYISKGVWNNGTIKFIFKNGKAVGLDMWVSGEADFEIKNIYKDKNQKSRLEKF